jgi:hypothetical protein
VTANADLIDRETRTRADRERLADEDERELDRLAQLADLMRQVPAQLGRPLPRALHAMARDRATGTAATARRTR